MEIVNLLLKNDTIKSSNQNTKNINFIDNLIESLKDNPTKLTKLLKDLKIDIKELNEKSKEILNKLNIKLDSKNIDNNINDKKNSNIELVQNNINYILNEKEISNEEKIKYFKSQLQKLPLPIKTKEKIKNASNLKELIHISKKIGLNITKIKIEKIDTPKTPPPPKKIDIPIKIKNTLEKSLIPKNNSNITTLLKQPQIHKNTSNNKNSIKNLNNKTTNNSLNLTENNLPKQKIENRKITLEELVNVKNNIHTHNKTKNNPTDKIELNRISIKKDPEIPLQTPLDISQVKHSIVEAKQNIQQISSKLLEATINYKPPITSISISLNPKELGKLDIQLIKKGKQVEIQINSQNNQAINFLQANQIELKNSLQNIGFTNINMDFNSQKEKQNQQQQKQKTKYRYEEEIEDVKIEMEYKYA